MKQGGKRRSKAAQKALNDTVNLKPLGIGSIKRTPKFVGDPAAESTIEYTVSEILAEGTRKGKRPFSRSVNVAMQQCLSSMSYVMSSQTVWSNVVIKSTGGESVVIESTGIRESRNRIDRHQGKSKSSRQNKHKVIYLSTRKNPADP